MCSTQYRGVFFNTHSIEQLSSYIHELKEIIMTVKVQEKKSSKDTVYAAPSNVILVSLVYSLKITEN